MRRSASGKRGRLNGLTRMECAQALVVRSRYDFDYDRWAQEGQRWGRSERRRDTDLSGVPVAAAEGV